MRTLKFKQILAIAAVVVMAVAYMPVLQGARGVANAAENVATIVETGKNYDTVQAAVDAAQKDQTVKLLSDVDLTSTINIASDKDVTLDLNGKTLDGSGIAEPKNNYDKASVIFINTRTTLTLNDSSTGTPGKITGGKGYLYGFNNNRYTYGGGVCMNDGGTLNLYKISITGNTANYGGGVYVRSGTFNMYSGKISNNKAYYVLRKSDQNKIGGFGGGVMIAIQFGYDTRVNMYGGEISGNSVDSDSGGVHMSGEAYSDPSLRYKTILTVSGAAKITGNIFCKNGITKPANVHVQKATPIIIGQDGLKPGAEIGVKFGFTTGTRAVTTNGTANDTKYFTSDNQAYKVKFVKGDTSQESKTFLDNDHLELVDYDLTAAASDTKCLNFEKDDMTEAQAIAIAQAQKPYNALEKNTCIVYATAADSKYKVITASPETDWKAGTDITLTKIKTDLAKTDYFVIGNVTAKEAAKLVAAGKAYKKSIKYTWNKVNGAVKYKVYQSRSGKKAKCVKTTTALSFTKKSLKKGKYYQAYVAAYNKSGIRIATSPVSKVMTKGGKYANAKKVKAFSKIPMFAGYTEDVNARIVKKDSNKKLAGGKLANNKIRYYSGDPYVATVSSDGVVNALRKGTVYIYSVAPSGAYSVTKVVVEK